MEIFLISLSTFIIGALLTYFFLVSKYKTKITKSESEMFLLKGILDEKEKYFNSTVDGLKERLDAERKSWESQKGLIQQQFTALASDVLEKKSLNLYSENKKQMDDIIRPLTERLKDLDTAVNETKKESAVNKNSMEILIKDLMSKAQTIGDDAVNLTRALKGNSKIQGDWGEMILEKMLEDSGLKLGEEYYKQENTKTSDGLNVRPDFIVRFPENRCLVIDSKVSLTAYSNYMSAVDDASRATAIKEHLLSMRRHIDELAAVDYSKKVKDTIGYVLMFVPNEASYIVALQNDSNIIQYAYKKQIILISPSNLMMALQMAYNLWQTDKQTKNVEKIVERGNELYNKVAGFIETFSKLDASIDAMRKTYDTAYAQLASGRGNVVRQFEMLKDLGLNPSKSIPEKVLGDSLGEE